MQIFFNNFSGFKIKSNSPDFKYGSGNELSAVPIIFTRQSEKFYNTRNLQFLKAQNISKKINHGANIKNVTRQFLTNGLRERYSDRTEGLDSEASKAGKRLARIRVSFYNHSG